MSACLVFNPLLAPFQDGQIALCFNVLEQLSAIKLGHFVTPLDRGLLYVIIYTALQ